MAEKEKEKEAKSPSQESFQGKRKCDVLHIAKMMFGDHCIQAINMDFVKREFEVVIWSDKIDEEICSDKMVTKKRYEEKLVMCKVTFIKKDK